MQGLRVTVAILAAAAAVSAQGNMYGTGGSSWSTSGGGSSSSSSSSSSGGGGISNSAISQSQAGGRVEMNCGGVVGGDMVWFRQDGEGGGRRELARNGRLISAPTRYRLTSAGGSSTLTINPTQTSDTGLFICESRTASGQTSTHTYKLTIGFGGGSGGGNSGGTGGGNGGSARTAGAATGFMGAMMLLM